MDNWEDTRSRYVGLAGWGNELVVYRHLRQDFRVKTVIKQGVVATVKGDNNEKEKLQHLTGLQNSTSKITFR